MRSSLVLFLFPASQAFVYSIAILWALTLGLPGYVYVFIIAGMAVSVPVNVHLFREVKRAQELDRAQINLRLLEEQDAIQRAYRQSLAKDAKQIEGIKDSIRLKLADTAALLRERQRAAALRELDDALSLAGDCPARLCEHRSADAAMTLKLRLCRDQNVDAHFALDIPDDIGLPSAELCAVLLNLVDNALAAALRARAEDEGRDVGLGLCAWIRNGHLVVESSNDVSYREGEEIASRGKANLASPDAVKRFDEEHGWGLSIIKGIAERHHGAVKAELKDDIYCVQVFLRLDEAGGLCPT